jgi:hypothetical protein
MKTKTEEQIKDINLQILQLTELQNLCIKLKKSEDDKQDNSELLDLLKKNYTLTTEEISTITSMVEGKRKAKGVVTDDVKTLKNKFDSYCVICGINPNSRNGEFMGYDKFSNKCSNKKSILNKELEKSKSERLA